MPHFCKCGADEYICQVCGRIRCSQEQPGVWGKIPGKSFKGNICPTCQKEIPMEQIVNQFAVETFGRSKSESIEKKICVTCGGKAGLFTSLQSVKEYKISGMCQKCQDKVGG